MQVEIFTVCRELRAAIAATDILGIHHSIRTDALPVRLAGSHLLLSVRFVGEDAIPHPFEIRFIDDDGGSIAPAFHGTISRKEPALKQEIQNYNFHLNGVRLTKHGDYWFDLFLDGDHSHRLPFSVNPRR